MIMTQDSITIGLYFLTLNSFIFALIIAILYLAIQISKRKK